MLIIGCDYHPGFQQIGRVARALDLVGSTNTVCAPFFAHSAKGGNHEPVRNRVQVGQSVVTAASYPPLQKTQGRGTLSRDGARRIHRQSPGRPPKAKAGSSLCARNDKAYRNDDIGQTVS